MPLELMSLGVLQREHDHCALHSRFGADMLLPSSSVLFPVPSLIFPHTQLILNLFLHTIFLSLPQPPPLPCWLCLRPMLWL